MRTTSALYRGIIVSALILGLGSFTVLRGQDAGQALVKRYVVAIGANSGGKDRVQLRYAATDAESVLKVFTELGGVSPEDSRLILDPDLKTIFTNIGKLQAELEEVKKEFSRVEVFFYYSGHSDEGHLLIGNEKISYQDWREAMDSLDADVRIAILDSCASGAFTRPKGGKKKLPFLFDSAFNMSGFAVMTSSSATEASQESDVLKGSFFTHYLISGLRGAADMNQDGRVTLSEAYQFAFNETLAETTKTVSGPQHPNYDIQMTGTGDVIMTDIRRSAAVLVLKPEIDGRVFIHNANNILVLELSKPLGRTIELGLEPGNYRIINIIEDSLFESRIELQTGRESELGMNDLAPTDKIYTTPRGDRAVKIRKETLLQGKSSLHFFGEFNSKLTPISGNTAILLGGQVGLTFNRIFSVGIGGYGRSDFSGGFPGQISYGGVKFAYAFNPQNKWHFRITALAGTGVNWMSAPFYILEPGLEGVLNLSRIVRIQAGLSFPLTDVDSVELNSPIISLGFQFGK